ncbi:MULTISPECIES: hypothetical protein [Flavobacterium]|uniref:Beta-lactamase-inhibitor-like PepSY-like domain-containing protein n=1 Tax=Flavobacterium jumunjinense TaxID=998845 RepID=A0ABV5GPE8_9FLAO|nr:MULTISPECIES: hypothetical protein [Flavobacterium]
MKRIILLAIFGFASISTFSVEKNTSVKTQITVAQEEYKELPVDKLPTAVKEAVKKDFEGAVITKAYINEDKEYKLELQLETVTQTVFIDANGYWLEKE